MIEFLGIDKELEEEGWNLLLIRSHEQWRCHYSHVAHLPCSAVGLDRDAVIAAAQRKVREGK